MLSNLKLGPHGIAVYPPGATFGPRRLKDYEFVWIMEGDVTFHLNQQAIQAPPGTIILAQKGMQDSYEWSQKSRTIHAFFHFDCDLPPDLPRPSNWPLALEMPKEDILRPLFGLVLSLLKSPPSPRPPQLNLSVELLLRSYVTQTIRTLESPISDWPEPVEKAIRVIRLKAYQEFTTTLSLKDLAEAAHVAPEHLCRLFKRTLNLTPVECVRLVRLERAATLLERSNLNVKQISDSVGFKNPYHFSAAFQKVYHRSPRAYRNMAQKGQPLPSNRISQALSLSPPPSTE
jgi:AraC family transcriptional regulator